MLEGLICEAYISGHSPDWSAEPEGGLYWKRRALLFLPCETIRWLGRKTWHAALNHLRDKPTSLIRFVH